MLGKDYVFCYCGNGYYLTEEGIRKKDSESGLPGTIVFTIPEGYCVIRGSTVLFQSETCHIVPGGREIIEEFGRLREQVLEIQRRMAAILESGPEPPKPEPVP